MATFRDLVSRVRQQLLGFTLDQASVSELSQAMDADDTTFTVDTATVTNVSRGLVEIDDELILVKSYDRQSGVVSVMGAANGRGVEGTTAAAHAVSALVTASPAFPRAQIKTAINDAIRGLYPDLVVFATTEITNSAVVYKYAMPAEATDVWSVGLQTVGPTKIWQQAQHFRFDPDADPDDFPSGRAVEIFDPVTPGRAMRVRYAKAPSDLSADADDFAAVTGYPDRVSDVVVWGACSRLVPALEAGRLQQQAVESTERAPLVPVTSALKSAQYFSQMYYQRLQEERRRMFEEAPNQQFYGS